MNLVSVWLSDIFSCSDANNLLCLVESPHFELIAELQFLLVFAFPLGGLRKTLSELIVDVIKVLLLLGFTHEENVGELWVAVTELFLEFEREGVDVIGDIKVIVKARFFGVLLGEGGRLLEGGGMGAI